MSDNIIHTFLAGGTISRGYAVYLDGADSEEAKVCADPLDRRVIGIAMHDASSGNQVQVCIWGKCKGKVNGTAELGDVFVCDTGGKLTKMAAGGQIAIATQIKPLQIGASTADSADEDLVDVFVSIPAGVRGMITYFSSSKTWDPASVNDGATVTTTLTVTGAATGDHVVVTRPAALDAGLVVDGHVSAANTVTLTITNASGGAINAAELVYPVIVFPAAGLIPA